MLWGALEWIGDALRVVWMLPDVVRLDGVDHVFAAEERADSTGCVFDLVRTVCGQLLSQFCKAGVMFSKARNIYRAFMCSNRATHSEVSVIVPVVKT